MAYALQELPPSLAAETAGLGISDILGMLTKTFPGGVVFSSSFSNEDQVITHMIAAAKLDIAVFTLDTGRLFPQTYATWSSTVGRYGLKIRAYTPDHAHLEPFLEEKGPDAFYASVENRKACCHIRKVAPLKRALAGNAVWITGLRAEHSPDRQQHTHLEWDEGNRIIKYNPLLHWTTEAVTQYIREHHIPYNVLHDQGFASIGCAPCTRAIRPGEDFRAGRWWWEDNTRKECGLHLTPGKT